MFGYTLPLTQGEKFDALIADFKRPLKRARSILGTADVYGLGLDHGSMLVVVVMFITSPIRAVAKVIDAILGLMLSEDNLLRVALKQLVKFSVALTFACIDSAMMLAMALLKIVYICFKLVMLIKDLVNHLLFFISAIFSFVASTLPNVFFLDHRKYTFSGHSWRILTLLKCIRRGLGSRSCFQYCVGLRDLEFIW